MSRQADAQIFGLRMRDVCRAVRDGGNGDGWCEALSVLGRLREIVPVECATRLYQHWGNHAKTDEHRQAPADVQVARGRRCVVLRALSNAKRAGLLLSRGQPGVRREYRLTDAGRALIHERE